MLIGQFTGRIGEKFRIAFPKKFRDVLGDKVIVTRGFEGSLIVVSEDGWTSLLEGTQGKPFTGNSTREMQRFLLGGASLIELDDKGRFILPEYLRNYAGLTDEVVFLGISRYVEIWDKKRWDEYERDLSKNIGVIAERLSKEE